jgi:hypothetical protein
VPPVAEIVIITKSLDNCSFPYLAGHPPKEPFFQAIMTLVAFPKYRVHILSKMEFNIGGECISVNIKPCN